MHKSIKLGLERLEQRDNPAGWSFWEDTYLGNGFQVLGQGGANIANGVQDIGIGLGNLPAVVYNNTAGNLGGGQIGYIESPDWSKDLIIENDQLHGTSKFVGGNGAFIIITFGASTIASGGRAAGAAAGEAGAAAGSSGAAASEAGAVAGGEVAAVGGQALPTLTRGKDIEMLGEAIRYVKTLPKDAAARADAFEALAGQIEAGTGGTWSVSRTTGTDGSTIFLGRQGEALVVRPDGGIFRGALSKAIEITKDGLRVIPDLLRPLD